MRRALAWIGIILSVGGFVLLALSIWLNIHFLIPVGMIVAAGLLLIAVKKMPESAPEKSGEEKKDEHE